MSGPGSANDRRRKAPQELPAFPDLQFELELWGQGIRLVGGVDEAGRGALAGPVASAVVVLPVDANLPGQLDGVRDSKQMTPRQRERWAERLHQVALAWGVGFAGSGEIDRLGIVPATRLSVMRALQQLPLAPEHLLLDFLQLPDCSLPQTALIKGDARCLSIASASVLAKTARDAVMRRWDVVYPDYGFAAHKGYGTRAHRQALARLGPTPIHRRSFRYQPLNDIDAAGLQGEEPE